MRNRQGTKRQVVLEVLESRTVLSADECVTALTGLREALDRLDPGRPESVGAVVGALGTVLEECADEIGEEKLDDIVEKLAEQIDDRLDDLGDSEDVRECREALAGLKDEIDGPGAPDPDEVGSLLGHVFEDCAGLISAKDFDKVIDKVVEEIDEVIDDLDEDDDDDGEGRGRGHQKHAGQHNGRGKGHEKFGG